MFKRMRLCECCAIAILLLSGIGNAAAQIDHNAPHDFDLYVQNAMRQWDVPGVAIGLVRDGKLIQVRGYGVRTIGKSDPVDANTVFAIASATKAFTAAALAVLVDERKIAWDDPVIRYLRNLRLHDPQVTVEVTIRDLLAQRNCPEANNLLTWDTPFDQGEIFRRLQYLKPSCTFRDHFEYNNINYVMAGWVVAAVTGKSCWFAEERIFDPLGMTSSTAITATAAKSGNLATPYLTVGGKLKPIPLFDEGASPPRVLSIPPHPIWSDGF
jgi:CubicO group peptidase (beta-lactamase class C family)